MNLKCKECGGDLIEFAPNQYNCQLCNTNYTFKNPKAKENKKIELKKIDKFLKPIFALSDYNVFLLLLVNLIMWLIVVMLMILLKYVSGYSVYANFIDFFVSLSVSVFFFISAYKLGEIKSKE